MPLNRANLRVGECPELDARHILQPDDRSVRLRAHGDLTELLGGLEPSFRSHGERVLLAGRSRHGTDLAGRVHRALLLDRPRQVRHGEPELREANRA